MTAMFNPFIVWGIGHFVPLVTRTVFTLFTGTNKNKILKVILNPLTHIFFEHRQLVHCQNATHHSRCCNAVVHESILFFLIKNV